MRIKVPFGTQAYQSRSLPVNNQEMVNMYSEVQPQDGKDRLISIGFPGSTLYATSGTGPIHGMKVMDGVLYVVSGTSLYRVQNGIATSLGTIAGNVRVSMEHNGTELCITNGSNAYIYDTSNGLQTITDADFYQSKHVAYLERRFLFTRPGTNQFFSSNAFNGTSYNALYFDQVLTVTENTVTVVADHGELWVFTNKGAEVWVYNRDESAFPYSRLDGAYVEKGIAAEFSVGKLDNTFYWLGDDRVVYRADNYKPTRISTHAIESDIQSYSKIDDAFALTYEIEGHAFYEITFPTANKTWRFDASTGFWHEARFGENRYHANATEFFENKVLIGDRDSGNIYYLDYDSYTDNGTTIHGIVSSPQIHVDRRRAVMDRLNIDIESGVGLTDGSDPKLMMKYSKDGGKTWSSEKWTSMGLIGEYANRVKFDNLGSFYQIMFKLEISDPVKRVIINAYADIELDDSY